MDSTIESNPQAELAFRFITETNQHVFLTGRAGTGKTTFLHRIREECMKQLVVVAPTGVAAINAKGVTIHSMFQLPFGNIMPDQHTKLLGQRQLSKEKQRVLQSLDLLIIDEISMVRADVLDAINWTLRRYRNPRKPFGGVQLLMIGDLHQLPPVVRDQDVHVMRQHYATPYFFSCLALKQAGVQTIELLKIYRQRDDVFVKLLNEVRENRMTPEVLAQLNSRFRENIKPGEDAGVITLTSHRNSATQLNSERLSSLITKTHTFKAKVNGKFPEHAYPTEAKLELKVGAQVMFVKNDPPPERAYFNGKIGVIEKIDSEGNVHVYCEGDAFPIKVGVVAWENKKYKVDEKTKEVDEALEGSFNQVPLRLAWAITIHKSQGLTFDKVIIDAQSAFAHGQVYVALSRCRTFEGIQLLSEIKGRSVRTDSDVNSYTQANQDNPPTETQLDTARLTYHKQLVRDAFDLNALLRELHELLRYYIENEKTFASPTVQLFEDLVAETEVSIFQHSKNFLPFLMEIQNDQDFTEDLVPVNERTTAAATYFIVKLENQLKAGLNKISFATDNQSTKTRATSHRKDIDKFIRVALSGLAYCKQDFDPKQYVRSRAKAMLGEADFTVSSTSSSSGSVKDLPVSDYPELYKSLHVWRKQRALDDELPTASKVTSIRALIEMSNDLPITLDGLKKVKGVGKQTLAKFGEDILKIVQAYCTKYSLEGDIAIKNGKGKAKPPVIEGVGRTTETKQESYNLFKSGMSLAKVAEERGLKETTIVSHLAHFVVKGDVPVSDFLSPTAIDEISSAVEQTTDVESESGHGRLNAMFQLLDGKYGYGYLRMVLYSQPNE
ncbi:MAG: helix-turn-helix domain-containing protein [Saprospiraceae bacterium]